MVKVGKEKKKMNKKLKLVLILVPVLILLGVLGYYFPIINYYGRNFFNIIDTGHKLVDTTLSMDQKLSDLEYMYDIVCLQNPRKDLFEKEYGISYEEIYNRYREYVKNSKSDYEYYSYIACFVSILPGEHNSMSLPNFQKGSSSFVLTEIFASQKMKDYTYSWSEAFRDDVKAEREYSIIAFDYVDGKYINIISDTELVRTVNDYANGQLLTIDGKDPKDMCFDFLSRFAPVYDKGNNCYFREKLFFSNGIGVEHDGEILMPDGKVVKVKLYEDPGFEMAWADGPSNYPELVKTSGEAAKTSSEQSTKPQTYRIATDASRKLVYLDTFSCHTTEAERLVSDLTKALDEVDADTVIVDVRSNEGGSVDYCNKILLPLLFSHDLKYNNDVYAGKNKFTKKYYNNPYYRYYINKPLRFEGNTFIFNENFDVEAKAKKNYKIYLLTSQQTFSSADLMARLCKAYDNATVIGTNTRGEGICGTPFNCYLPNSRFMFVYTAPICKEYPEDSITGTDPDHYIPYTVEEYLKRKELVSQGKTASLYENRQTWDKTLLYVLDQIDDKKG